MSPDSTTTARVADLVDLYEQPVQSRRFITEQEVLRFYFALDEQPRHLMVDGVPRLAAHPMFHFVLRTSSYMLVPRSTLTADGTSQQQSPAWSSGVVAGESRLVRNGPLLADQEVHMMRTLAEVVPKSGRTGDIYLATCHFDVYDHAERHILRESFTRIYR